MNLLCKIGLHRRYADCEFLPSMHAKIVTDAFIYVKCARCGAELRRKHWKWDEESGDMIEIEPEAKA